MEQLAKTAGKRAARGRVVLAHLGNGASLAAVRGGRPIDTSMGFTPTAGVPMSSRAGDLDPGLVWYLARTSGMTAKQFNEMVNFRSGLLGVSGVSSDMRDLLGRESSDSHAADAVALFAIRSKNGSVRLPPRLADWTRSFFPAALASTRPLCARASVTALSFLGSKSINVATQPITT